MILYSVFYSYTIFAIGFSIVFLCTQGINCHTSLFNSVFNEMCATLLLLKFDDLFFIYYKFVVIINNTSKADFKTQCQK